MSYTVKIVDNKTGKVICDREDIVCLVGAFANEKGVQQTTIAQCDGFVLCKTLNAVEAAVTAVEAQNTDIGLKRRMLRIDDMLKAIKKADEENPDNTDS